jgi:hypothetical protein
MMFFSSFAVAQSTGFNTTFIVLSLNGVGSTFYDLQANAGKPDFNRANLGSFCQESNDLVYRGA